MNRKEKFRMTVVTCELRLDEILSGIVNNLPYAQKPKRAGGWEIMSDKIVSKSLGLRSTWGGCLY